MVIFDTNTVVRDPAELTRLLPSLPPSSVFYHLVDARHRPAHGRNDFQEWLEPWGERYAALAEAIGAIDVYFTSLVRLKEDVVSLFESHVPGAIA